ncbi:MAG: DEAD/DEAH box helicase [Anaerolineales bacterium]|nr:DEAD/DEAH box helicase [Anaerolineales bacterium]
MSLGKLLSHWRSEPSIADNITEWRKIQPRSAVHAAFPIGLHPILAETIRQKGINSLYSHQELTWEFSTNGENVVVVTGTASGKSLAYNLPVLDGLLKNNSARALYLFPTKALSQDQYQELIDLTRGINNVDLDNLDQPGMPTYPINIGVYDGDTKPKDRPGVRKNSRIIITNPDMLHMGILPHHTSWADFFSDLQYIIIDEIHTYRGVFGSHVANVIRRLKRIARFYGASPRFILTSATISNPEEFAQKLIEEPVQLVDQDGSSRGPINFIVYNPPVVNEDLGIRRSALLESVRLAEDLYTYDIQTIIFGRSRRNIELILTYLRQNLDLVGNQNAQTGLNISNEEGTIRGYRSGYLPKIRRDIEHGLRTGKVRTVVATNALELGIDIGQMSASVLAGYPGSIASTWQQAGRAGRDEQPSLVIFVTTASPLDQFFAQNPDYFFDRSPESALINPDNLLILLAHLRCALFELPFEEHELFGNFSRHSIEELLDLLTQQGLVHHSNNKYFWMADQYPSQEISLRVASPRNILLQIRDKETWKTIGEVDYASGPWLVHPQAIYIQESNSYLVEELDLDNGYARMSSHSTDYYTIPKVETQIDLIKQDSLGEINGGNKYYGELLVTTQVVGFRQVKWFTHEQLGAEKLDLPGNELSTSGYWLSINQEIVNQLRDQGMWSNAPNNYGPNWKQQRDLTRERDGFRCQVCNRIEENQVHHVHHKIPFRQFASIGEANRLDNLITLCPSCHRRVETVVRLRSGLSGMGHVLYNIAPIFLMCDVRDLGVHSDPQSPLTDGEPAIVIYERVPAGIGFSQRLFNIHHELMSNAHDLVRFCSCKDGCPSCVGPAGENGYGGKQETLSLLSLLIEPDDQ